MSSGTWAKDTLAIKRINKERKTVCIVFISLFMDITLEGKIYFKTKP